MTQPSSLQDNDFEESSNPTINVSVTFRHTDSTEALKSYATNPLCRKTWPFCRSPGFFKKIRSEQQELYRGSLLSNW